MKVASAPGEAAGVVRHMGRMESHKVTVSNDITAIADRVMHRQLLPVDQTHAESPVRMVLESAQKVLAGAEPG